jgi:hypothetical protein
VKLSQNCLISFLFKNRSLLKYFKIFRNISNNPEVLLYLIQRERKSLVTGNLTIKLKFFFKLQFIEFECFVSKYRIWISGWGSVLQCSLMKRDEIFNSIEESSVCYWQPWFCSKIGLCQKYFEIFEIFWNISKFLLFLIRTERNQICSQKPLNKVNLHYRELTRFYKVII